mmetsp:Transcript_106450/g.311207  ORF Transcript_106450/g.311207 Transcript_106450/m.311207 type:complete len:280 (-) Transcript_106450:318-1157(-)
MNGFCGTQVTASFLQRWTIPEPLGQRPWMARRSVLLPMPVLPSTNMDSPGRRRKDKFLHSTTLEGSRRSSTSCISSTVSALLLVSRTMTRSSISSCFPLAASARAVKLLSPATRSYSWLSFTMWSILSASISAHIAEATNAAILAQPNMTVVQREKYIIASVNTMPLSKTSSARIQMIGKNSMKDVKWITTSTNALRKPWRVPMRLRNSSVSSQPRSSDTPPPQKAISSALLCTRERQKCNTPRTAMYIFEMSVSALEAIPVTQRNTGTINSPVHRSLG